jgi:hypothetical protein
MSLMVIETEDDIFLGSLDITGDKVRVKTHTRGHPVFLDIKDIVRLTPAEEHEAVEGNARVDVEPHTAEQATIRYVLMGL